MIGYKFESGWIFHVPVLSSGRPKRILHLYSNCAKRSANLYREYSSFDIESNTRNTFFLPWHFTYCKTNYSRITSRIGGFKRDINEFSSTKICWKLMSRYLYVLVVRTHSKQHNLVDCEKFEIYTFKHYY